MNARATTTGMLTRIAALAWADAQRERRESGWFMMVWGQVVTAFAVTGLVRVVPAWAAVLGITFGFAVAGAKVPDVSDEETEHLPVVASEAPWALLLSRCGLLLAVVLVAGAVRAAWALAAEAGSVERGPFVALARGLAEVGFAWFAALAPWTLRRWPAPVLRGVPRPGREHLVGSAVLALAWVATGTAAAAAVLSLGWALAGPWPAEVEDPDAAGAGEDADEDVLDPGVVPLVGPAAVAVTLRAAAQVGRALVVTVVVFEGMLRSAPLVLRVVGRVFPTWAIDVPSLVDFLARFGPWVRAAFGLMLGTMGRAAVPSWHPALPRPFDDVAPDLLARLRHLPVEPTGVIDVPWATLAVRVAVGTAVALAWTGVVGALDRELAVAIVASAVLGTTLEAVGTWWAMLRGAGGPVPTPTGPGRTGGLAPMPMAMVLVLRMSDTPTWWLAPVALGGLAGAAGLWWLTRRAWSR